MVISSFLILVFAFSGSFRISVQGNDSLLLRTVKANLVVEAEVVAVSNLKRLCYPLQCQAVTFRVSEVLKGVFDSTYLNVEFPIETLGPFTEKHDNYNGLNRKLFIKGRRWILALDTESKFIPQVISDEMEQYKSYPCMHCSTYSITLSSDKEKDAFRMLIKARGASNQ